MTVLVSIFRTAAKIRSTAGRRYAHRSSGSGGLTTIVALASKSIQISRGAQAEIDARIVQAQRGLNLRERLHGAGSEHARHILQKLGVFGAMVRAFRHFGGEIVDLPVAGNRHMQRIELPIDHHHAILAHLSVGAPGVEELDDGQFGSREVPPRRLASASGLSTRTK